MFIELTSSMVGAKFLLKISDGMQVETCVEENARSAIWIGEEKYVVRETYSEIKTKLKKAGLIV